MGEGGFVGIFVTLSLEAAPWLLLGLVVAGLVKAWFPEERLEKWLGGGGVKPIVKAALIGVPLPLCSCGVIPVAIALRKGGASRGAAISFLVSTPETGIDSIAVSYAFFGPFLTIARPVAAIFTAVTTALVASLVPDTYIRVGDHKAGCCASGADKGERQEKTATGLWIRSWNGIAYALSDMLEDIFPWILFGIVFAAIITAFVPESTLSQWGGGVFGMIFMIAIGIPMYICATAATPIAAGLLVAGVSPGAAMVFLLAGPATNIATLGMVRREMGSMVAMAYLASIVACSIIAGLAVDMIVGVLAIDVQAQVANVGDIVPLPLAVSSAVLLAFLGIATFVRRIIPYAARTKKTEP